VDVGLAVSAMTRKTSYKVWFAIGGLYLLGGMYPLSVAQRTIEHRSFSMMMGIFWIFIGTSCKKKYEKQLAPAVNPAPRD
jgi:hypothetical protein